ncbi:MAG: 3'(2'),5'-bisphosphate nucleotidase [Gammaproteobacteria bacterium]|nr:3'(2'),5'-bisphosphate nucleotidase [Gammaproteobacteria bacterium]
MSNELSTAIRAVSLACAVTRRVQADLKTIAEMTKDDRSPVTVADFAAQAVVAHALCALPEPLRMVGEESSHALRDDTQSALRAAVTRAVAGVWSDADDAAVMDAIDLGNHDASSDSYWTLDPVDGTKGFIRGQQYAISLARIENGHVVLGVLGCPNLSADFAADFNSPDPHGCLFYATLGGGTFTMPADNIDAPPQQVRARETAEGQIQVCESVEAAHSKQDDSAAIVASLGGAGTPARLDSQCKYAVVARGQADAYLRLPTRKGYMEKIWDHAAGALVASEAGAIVTDITGAPLDFSHGTTLAGNRGVICASSVYHAKIIQVIGELGLAG